MNSVARISNLLRHRDERSALCVESHNCCERGEQSIARKVSQSPTVRL